MLFSQFYIFRKFFTDKAISLDKTFFSSLFLLFPIVLITGPALPDIFLSLIAIYFLIVSLKNKLWIYYKNPIVITFLAFCIYSFLRSLFSEFPIESLSNEGSVFYFRYIFFSMGVWYLFDHNPYLARCFIIISFICVVIVTLDGFFQYFTGVNFFGSPKHSSDRLTGLMGDSEPIIGRYVSQLSIILFALIFQFYKKTKKTNFFSFLLLLTSLIITFLSGERAPLFTIVFFILLVFVFFPINKVYLGIGIFISFSLLWGIILINPEAKNRIIDHSFKEINQTKYKILPYGPVHEEHYITALRMFNDNPLFGIGTNSFKFFCNQPDYRLSKVSCTSHPHNMYLQILSELGMFGISFLLILLIYLSYLVFRQLYFTLTFQNNKKIPYNYFLIPIVLIVFWWPLIPHMSFYNNWNNVFIMLPLGFLMRYLYGKPDNGYLHKI